MAHRRIRVRGVRREEIDADAIALCYWLMAKRAVEEKRRRDAEDTKARIAGRARMEERSNARG